MSVVVMFAIARKFGDCIQSGWSAVVEAMLHLHVMKLLPDRLVEKVEFLSPEFRAQLKAKVADTLASRSSRNRSLSLFESLASYFSFASAPSPTSESTEPSENDIHIISDGSDTETEQDAEIASHPQLFNQDGDVANVYNDDIATQLIQLEVDLLVGFFLCNYCRNILKNNYHDDTYFFNLRYQIREVVLLLLHLLIGSKKKNVFFSFSFFFFYSFYYYKSNKRILIRLLILRYLHVE